MSLPKILKIFIAVVLSSCLFFTLGISKCQREAEALEEQSQEKESALDEKTVQEMVAKTQEESEETIEEEPIKVTIYDTVFYSNHEDPSIEDHSAYAIYAVMSDGSDLIKIFDSGTGDFSPSWNSSHTQIVFGSFMDGDGDSDIFIYDLEIDEVSKIFDEQGNDNLPEFGPNDNSITFAHYEEPGDAEIFTVNPDGTGPLQLTDNSYLDSYPHFSPDGDEIIFTSNSNGANKIYSMNTDGTDVMQLTNFGDWNDFDGSINPDGGLVFVSDRSGDNDIYVLPIVDNPGLQLELSMTEVKNLTDNPANDSSPTFSADGEDMVFVSDRDSEDNKRSLYMMKDWGKDMKVFRYYEGNPEAEYLDPDYYWR